MQNGEKTESRPLDLTGASVWHPPDFSQKERKAALVLVEEVERRTNIRWPIIAEMPQGGGPLILLGQAPALAKRLQQDHSLPGWIAAETGEVPDGFQILTRSDHASSRVLILGNDARGILFGVGYLLRHLHMTKGSVALGDELNIITAPRYQLRGHQLGYRDKTNSYDGWDLPQWDRYIRELAVFGTNAIELIPPRSDDRADSVHFPLPPMPMMEGMSRIADDYGLDVWIWHPALDDDYSRPAMVQFALDEWEQVYKRLPRIDAILVPGGDPGNTRPKHLLPMLQQQTALLQRYHPQAQMWISAQGFDRAWMDEFLTILHDEKPAWLSGVVYGPWIHMTIAEFRQLIPAQYPIRNYPDITHSLDCQYPVAEWDIAFALTEGRETINPRPRAQHAIFRQMGEDVIGFVTYSEGCNDDVNKFIWSGLGWDPAQNVVDILRQYSRFFIGETYAQDFALGLLALERNWVGPLAANDSIPVTLQQFQVMESSAAPQLLQNWRFQQALYRAYYDAYTRRRLTDETSLEERALDRLGQAAQLGSLGALDLAERILEQAVTQPIASGWRTRIYQLAEALFQSIHMQLSVSHYAAQSETRGANLDGLDYPLNDRPWLTHQFGQIRALDNEQARLEQIHRILAWKNPGPGGYYVDLSNAYHCPLLVDVSSYEDDPGFYRTPQRRFPYWKEAQPIRRSWRGYTGMLNDVPFRLHFSDLDPAARYRLRIVYSDTEEEIRIRLIANDTVEIHPFLLKPSPREPMEFEIPWAATRQGKLTLSLSREPGKGGLGAGHEVSEIWIIRQHACGSR